MFIIKFRSSPIINPLVILWYRIRYVIYAEIPTAEEKKGSPKESIFLIAFRRSLGGWLRDGNFKQTRLAVNIKESRARKGYMGACFLNHVREFRSGDTKGIGTQRE